MFFCAYEFKSISYFLFYQNSVDSLHLLKMFSFSSVCLSFVFKKIGVWIFIWIFNSFDQYVCFLLIVQACLVNYMTTLPFGYGLNWGQQGLSWVVSSFTWLKSCPVFFFLSQHSIEALEFALGLSSTLLLSYGHPYPSTNGLLLLLLWLIWLLRNISPLIYSCLKSFLRFNILIVYIVKHEF